MVFTLSTPILLWLILIQPMLQNTYPWCWVTFANGLMLWFAKLVNFTHSL
jgi:hypothetical protein